MAVRVHVVAKDDDGNVFYEGAANYAWALEDVENAEWFAEYALNALDDYLDGRDEVLTLGQPRTYGLEDM